jgi:hypothetical protein
MALPLDRTFNVVADCERFEEYIGELREAVRDPTEPPPLAATHPNLYRLRQTTRREPRQWLHLRMVARNAEIIVWIRTDNLYVVGFEQVRGARYEFGVDPANDAKEKNKKKKDKEKKAKKKNKKEDQEQQERRPLISGATFLGFNGGYGDLRQLQTVS